MKAFETRRATPRASIAGVIALGALFAGFGSGCHGHASPEDCRAIGEHYIDLAVHEAPGGASLSPAQVAAVRDVESGLKRAEPSFRAVQDHCDEVTRTEVSCAIDSTSTRAWEGCLGDAGR